MKGPAKATITQQELKVPYYFRNYNWSQSINVLNWYYKNDPALWVYDLGQIFKPASIYLGWTNDEDDNTYAYGYNPGSIIVYPVEDIFLRNGIELTWNEPLPGELPDEDTRIILGHIIPSRTGALGTIDTGIGLGHNYYDWFGLTRSNHDHSAEFHGLYHDREDLWLEIIDTIE